MSLETLNVPLTEEELSTVISALLFSCSVNVVSDTNEEYQKEMLTLAKRFKLIKPDIKLNSIQFLKEDDYEDSLSIELLEIFKNNLEVTSFDHI